MSPNLVQFLGFESITFFSEDIMFSFFFMVNMQPGLMAEGVKGFPFSKKLKN